MKNIILIMNAIVLMLTLSIVVLPNLWMISVIVGKATIYPIIWGVYAFSVFLTAGFTFSWLIKSGK